jgi:hypothetical protein
MPPLDKATEETVQAIEKFTESVSTALINAIQDKDSRVLNQILGCIAIANPDLSASELIIKIKHDIEKLK